MSVKRWKRDSSKILAQAIRGKRARRGAPHPPPVLDAVFDGAMAAMEPPRFPKVIVVIGMGTETISGEAGG